MEEHNLFTRPQHKGKFKRSGKRKSTKANVVMKVGGRRISAAPINKTKYSFPVTITQTK